MAKEKNKKRKDKDIETRDLFGGMAEETVQGISAIGFFVLALLFILAALGKAGVLGEYTYSGGKSLFGIGYFLAPIILILLGIAFLRSLTRRFETLRVIGSLLLFVSALGLVELFAEGNAGLIGHFVLFPFMRLLDVYGSLIVLLGILVVSILILFNIPLKLSFSFGKNEDEEDGKKKVVEAKEVIINMPEELDPEEEAEARQKEKEAIERARKEAEKNKEGREKKGILDFGKEALAINMPSSFVAGIAFTPPPLSLLEKDRGKPEVGDIKANANIIKRTLQNFGITVEMDEVSIGPTVTRYSLKPAEGVKLSKILALNNDLALALAAHPIRIEAPIPGKSLVGIEIPNTTKTTVGLASLLNVPEYQESDKPLLISLGKSITGKAHFANLAKAPHMLIAGATGSGKSVTIHTLITSLLYRNSPENLRFIMIDPKRVELTLYNKIPHLLTPVITDAKKAIMALRFAAKEMDRRYDVLQERSVRDIESYHKTILKPAQIKHEKDSSEPLPETMPYMVIIIDELADIMQAYPRELEAAIVRLAQMSRAVGIHLVLSTQRPSVNVITGLIKANVPTRLALQVSSQIDSRTILDTPGAEKLLGAGDTLYLGGEMSKPLRLQGAYITETELKSVVGFLANAYKDELPQTIDITNTQEAGAGAAFSSMNDSMDGDDDELYEEARQIVIEAGKASTSYIQRKLRVGYARAARLMDILEERGVIGPSDGAKPREVLDSSGGSGAAFGTTPTDEVIAETDSEDEVKSHEV